MALQTTGPISLNDINIELPNKSSGDFISMNDNYVRDLIGKVAGTTMSLSEWYGASAQEIQTVTVGNYSAQYVTFYGYDGGVLSSGGFGSISDGTSSLYNEAVIKSLAQLNNQTLYFYVDGNLSNSGWTGMTVGSNTFLRSAANYTYNSGANRTQWQWTQIGGNPFGTTIGANVTVAFT